MSSINIYEKILDKFTNISIKANVKEIQKDLIQSKKDLKFLDETIENIEKIYSDNSEYYKFDNDDSDDDDYGISSMAYINFMIKNLKTKKKNLQEHLKYIEKKYNTLLEEEEIIDFLKNIINL